MGVEQVEHTLAYITRLRDIKEKMILGGVKFEDDRLLVGNDVDLFISLLSHSVARESYLDMREVISNTGKGIEIFTNPEMIQANLAVVTNLANGLDFISSDQPEYGKAKRALAYWDDVAKKILNGK